MIKNNKGVTLVELLIVIVVMGIIAAFSIPAVGTIIENTQKDAILADALSVENGAKLYCAQTTCTSSQTLTWTNVSPYVDGLDTALYDIGTSPGDTVATKTSAGWTVEMERAGNASGDWEFDDADAGLVPSATTSDRDDVTADSD